MTQTVERWHAPLELRSDGDGRTVAGIAVPYGQVADGPAGPEQFLPGAFRRAVGQRRGRPVKVFRDHDPARPVGLATSLEDTPGGLLIEARIADTALGDEALREIRAGLLDSFSVQFRALRERVAGGVREVLEAALAEVSLTARPVYEGALVTSLRSLDPGRIELPPRPEVWTGTITIAGVRWQ